MNSPATNDVCPCGSGKLWPDCHGIIERHGVTASTIDSTSPPPEMILKMARKISEMRARAEQRKILFGEAHIPNTIEFAGQRIVAAGGGVYAVDLNHSPLNFAGQLLVNTLGKEWFGEQFKLADEPSAQVHPIIEWYRATIDWQNKHAGPDGVCRGVFSGPVRAWFLLAYDVWVLTHYQMLQPLLPRLRDIRQFQGARYELTTYVLFIRGGFRPERDKETDNTSKHVEFIAHNNATGETVAVEAKSRHRPGVLGYPSAGHKTNEDPAPGITGRLRDALKQRKAMPYVICLELNLPPAASPVEAQRKLDAAQAEIEAVTQEYSASGEKFPATQVVVTNYSHHYGDPDSKDPLWYQCVISIGNAAHPFQSAQTATQIVDALASYGNLPDSWEIFDW